MQFQHHYLKAPNIMNVTNEQDFDYANQIRKLIKLGATPKDLIILLPSFFSESLTETAANAKAVRTYDQLKLKGTIKPSKRPVYFPTLAKTSKNHKIITNFGLQILVATSNTSYEEDLNEIFVDVYESYINNNPKTILNLQEAYAIFKYVINHKNNNYFKLVKKCPTCTSHYIFISHFSGREVCPYCKKPPL